MLMRQKQQNKRKGSVLVEYALLIAGIVLVSVVAIAVLGHKVSDNYGVMAAVMPGAHADDNAPIKSADGAIPVALDADGNLTLETTALVAAGGTDRMAGILGAGGGEILIVE
ncbi:MAG: hypothetical protein L0Y71_09965 [Gemmataceae bacterium]|nr:hypothetical protein [Gemmataceae bacterium]